MEECDLILYEWNTLYFNHLKEVESRSKGKVLNDDAITHYTALWKRHKRAKNSDELDEELTKFSEDVEKLFDGEK